MYLPQRYINSSCYKKCIVWREKYENNELAFDSNLCE